ncbi:Uncharacterised protein [Bacteroides intestinalis]|jgi:hypothetical protein|uniref:Uncharacterized protein n=1 Tax=Bacteroides intestinalis TaxID=329854 RepID=A0A6N2VYB7_9BACE
MCLSFDTSPLFLLFQYFNLPLLLFLTRTVNYYAYGQNKF